MGVEKDKIWSRKAGKGPEHRVPQWWDLAAMLFSRDTRVPDKAQGEWVLPNSSIQGNICTGFNNKGAKDSLTFASLFFLMFCVFLKREKKGEGERNWSAASHMRPTAQSRHAPWLGIELQHFSTPNQVQLHQPHQPGWLLHLLAEARLLALDLPVSPPLPFFPLQIAEKSQRPTRHFPLSSSC